MRKRNHDHERRTARRFQVAWDVSVKGTDETGDGFDEAGSLENLSSLGAFVYLPRCVQLGEWLELRIKIPLKRSNWMKYTAEVVRIEQASSRAAVAVKFDTAAPVFIAR